MIGWNTRKTCCFNAAACALNSAFFAVNHTPISAVAAVFSASIFYLFLTHPCL